MVDAVQNANNPTNALLRAQQIAQVPKPKAAQAIIHAASGKTSIAVPVSFKAVTQTGKANFSVNPQPNKPVPRGSIVDELV